MQLEYDIRDDKTAVITRIPQPEAVIVLPSFVEGCPVTEIGTDVISLGKKSIAREIVLPETLIKISERAFTDLRYLKKLSCIPSYSFDSRRIHRPRRHPVFRFP